MPLSLVPQVFFDLIARVIPGLVVVITWYLTIFGPAKAIDVIVIASSNNNIFNFWSFSSLILLSYVLGLILNELWSLTFGKIKSKTVKRKKEQYLASSLAENDKIRQCFGEPKLGLKGEDLPSFHIIHDHLRLYSESEAYRLLKLRAEARLSETLFIGFLLLPIINIFYWYYDSRLLMLDRAILEMAVIVAVLSFWRQSNRFEKFYIMGTCTSWLFFSFPIGPLKQEEVNKNKTGQ